MRIDDRDTANVAQLYQKKAIFVKVLQMLLPLVDRSEAEIAKMLEHKIETIPEVKGCHELSAPSRASTSKSRKATITWLQSPPPHTSLQ